MNDMNDRADVLTLTAEIVSAFASNNSLAAAELPEVIRLVYGSLESVGTGSVIEQKADPAVPIRRSIKRDYIICLECGSQHKMIKRHLAREHGLTPAAYRERWGLKPDYPMVAPSYAEKRSELAKRIGLGRKREDIAPAAETTAPTRRSRTRGGPVREAAE